MKKKPAANTQLNLQSLPRVRRCAAAIIVTLTILTSLGLARSSQAVPMLFTLTGVTFNDGATAGGSFVFNPTTGNFGAFLITTTTSVSNTGSTYSSLAGTSTFYLASPDAFIFDNFSIDSHYLVFSFSGHITGPGVYALDIGVANGPDSFLGSGEFVDMALDYRLVTGGFLTVTLVQGVPETGGTFFSLVISIIALSGFHLLQRQRASVTSMTVITARHQYRNCSAGYTKRTPSYSSASSL
jgi:hypothetical protein